MVRPRFGFVLLVSFSTFVAAQFEEAAGDFGSGEYPPSSPPPPSPPPRPPWSPIFCGAAGQPPCGRLVASGPNLLLDGAPFVARGVAYNPTPAGADRADYLADGNAAIWERDLPVLEALGANLLRVPPFAVDGERRHAEQVGAERLEHRQVALPDRRVAVGEVVGAVGARGSGVVRDAARDEGRAVEQQVGARGDEAAARRLARRATKYGRPRRPRRRRGRRRRGWRVFAGAEVAGCFFKLRGNERREGYEEDKAEARTHHRRPKVVLAVDASICAV